MSVCFPESEGRPRPSFRQRRFSETSAFAPILSGGESPLNTFDLVERHHGMRLLCHAIRHLLDHTPDDTDPGDVEAIDILQVAINPVEPSRLSPYRVDQPSTEVAACRIPNAGETILRTSDTHEADTGDDVVSEIVRDCPSPPSIRHEHPVSLLSLFELLLHAVHYRVLGRSRAATHETSLGSAR